MAPSRSAASSLTAYSITFSLLCTLLNGDTLASSIGCFVCSSFNGSDKNCEDTFNSSVINYDDPAVVYYQFPCWGYRKNRVGLFPADHCIKISGYKTENNSETMVIRTCALDSGTLTADTAGRQRSGMVYYRFSSASNRLIPAAQSLALVPQGLSVACANTNPVHYESGTKMFNSTMRVARTGATNATRMASSAAATGSPPANFDPLNPGPWMIGAGGKIVPRLPEGTKVGSLVMGKYGLYYPPLKAKVEEIEKAEAHGERMERATAGNRTLSNALMALTGFCLVLAFWNIASAGVDKPLPPFVNANKQIHQD